MLIRTCVACVFALLALGIPAATAAPAADIFSPDGYGPVTLGMSKKAALETGLVVQDTKPLNGCRLDGFGDGKAGDYLLTSEDAVSGSVYVGRVNILKGKVVQIGIYNFVATDEYGNQPKRTDFDDFVSSYRSNGYRVSVKRDKFNRELDEAVVSKAGEGVMLATGKRASGRLLGVNLPREATCK